MGQITATRNLVATKVVRHAGQQVRPPSRWNLQRKTDYLLLTNTTGWLKKNNNNDNNKNTHDQENITKVILMTENCAPIQANDPILKLNWISQLQH